jgi:hypothetical protein
MKIENPIYIYGDISRKNIVNIYYAHQIGIGNEFWNPN